MTLAIIQARLGSTRFPRKALADLGGRTVIQRVVDRVKSARGIDHVVLAVPVIDADLFRALFPFMVCAPTELESDVLARFAAVSAAWPKHDTIVRVTGDCPLWSASIAEHVLALYQADQGIEYASNIAPGYVDGEDVEVFSASALQWANRDATDPYDREHVTPWIRRHVKCATLQPETSEPKPKTSVDTMEDLERVRALTVQPC